MAERLPMQKGSALHRARRRSGVPETPEFRRIQALPRRDWEHDPYSGFTVEQIAEYFTDTLRRPGGKMALRPVQAKALQEAHDYGGLFAPIPVGNGKTLVSFLLPTVLKAHRPLLLIPAKLRDKTYREFAELLQHWQAHPKLEIQSYEYISRQSGTEYLLELSPDLIIMDECHRTKNRNAAVTRRITQYISARHPKVCAMSGTLIKRSLLDFSHIMHWCLPAGLVPLPANTTELELWAAAVDEIKATEQRATVPPHQLIELAPDPERVRQEAAAEDPPVNPRNLARRVLRDRFLATPGIISARCPLEIEASLDISLVLVDGYNARTHELASAVNQGVKPNGEIIEEDDLSASWRIMRTLTSGFWYAYKTPPPPEWLMARKDWQRVVRGYLEGHHAGMESPLMVAQRAARGQLVEKDCRTYLDWVAVRDTFKPETVPVWEDDTLIERVQEWTSKNRGIIWVSEVALGERLSAVLGRPYFHQLGKDASGTAIELADPRKGSIIASVASNSEGRNLQHWDANLIISPPPTGSVYEQCIARTHRPGQQSDTVTVDILVGCAVEWECFQQAQRDAHMASNLENPKKLEAATITTFRPPWGLNPLWAL